MPVTRPFTTVAAALLLLQTPPTSVLVSMIIDPTQTPDGPEIVPAVARATIVIGFEAVVVPKLFVTA